MVITSAVLRAPETEWLDQPSREGADCAGSWKASRRRAACGRLVQSFCLRDDRSSIAITTATLAQSIVGVTTESDRPLVYGGRWPRVDSPLDRLRDDFLATTGLRNCVASRTASRSSVSTAPWSDSEPHRRNDYGEAAPINLSLATVLVAFDSGQSGAGRELAWRSAPYPYVSTVEITKTT